MIYRAAFHHIFLMTTHYVLQASISSQNQWFPYGSPPVPSSTASAVHLPFGSQALIPGYPYGQPYPSPSLSSSPRSAYRANNVYSHPPYSSSSVQSLPLSPPSGSAVTYVQNANQHVVVPLNGGGFVVLPPGQQVQVIVSAFSFVLITCISPWSIVVCKRLLWYWKES